MLELERTFLPKYLPKGLKNCKSKEMIDIYVPEEARHPTLRIRKRGNRYTVTKKEPEVDDSSRMKEETVVIREDEFNYLAKLKGKRVEKIRYYHDHNGMTAEIDVFQGALKGLVLVDFEFETEKEKQAFKMPEFCSIDITQQEFIAGGMLCGKSYEDIEKELKKHNYKKLFL